MQRTVIFITTTMAFISSACATAQPVPGPSLRPLVSGAKLHLDTPLGTKIPVSYGRDGALSGNANGLGSYLGSEHDEGRWWVARGRLCHRWNTWFEAQPQCLSLQRRGVRLYWQNQDGKSGTATLVAAEKKKPSTIVVAATSRPTNTDVTEKTYLKAKVATAAKKHRPTKVEKKKTLATNASVPAATSTPPALLTAVTSKDLSARAGASLTAVTPSKAAAAAPFAVKTIKAVRVPVVAGQAGIKPQTQPSVSRLGALATPRLQLGVQQASTGADKVEAVNSFGQSKTPITRQMGSNALAVTEPKIQKSRLRMARAATRKQQIYRVSFVEPFDVLNVRSGPSEAFAVVGGLKPRIQGVKITGTCRIDWCPIRYRKIKGWVNRFYLQAVNGRKQPRKDGVRSSGWAAVAASTR